MKSGDKVKPCYSTAIQEMATVSTILQNNTQVNIGFHTGADENSSILGYHVTS